MKAVIVLSGGQDSATALAMAVRRHGADEVAAITFAYGQRHALETKFARALAKRFKIARHKVVKMGFLGELAPSALIPREDARHETRDARRETQGAGQVAATYSRKRGMSCPTSVVEGRNAFFLQAAAVWAKTLGATEVWTGVSEADFSGYPDCRAAFVRAEQRAIRLALDWPIRIVTPFIRMTKAEEWVLADRLGILDVIRDHTLTCYNGIPGAGCGTCPACRLRARGYRAFLKARKLARTLALCLIGGWMALGPCWGAPDAPDGVVCENGVCRLADAPRTAPSATNAVPVAAVAAPDRLAQGLMTEEAFLSFLSDEPAEDPFDGKGLVLILLLAILGGLAMNLTPCVLPMIPVNLMVIGASTTRGLLYGLGQMAAFGGLGLLAAFGGVAFGTVQSTPWFNGIVALLFAAFALALFGAFSLDFTRFRQGLKGGAFVLGAISALLAGACVAPILASVLLLTARLYAEGRAVALVLPFAVGFGLALPWPFLGSGLKVLPKPGGWMRWVNRLFAVLLLAFAVHYALLAVRGVVRAPAADARDFTPASLAAAKLLEAPRARPLLIVCHAGWCRNCTAMERRMEASPRIRAALENMDVIRLDAENPNELGRFPGLEKIKGLPAFALYGSKR